MAARKRAPRKFGRVAFISTGNFRDEKPEELSRFIGEHLYTLCYYFEVHATGRTHEHILKFLDGSSECQKWMHDDEVTSRQDEKDWTDLIRKNLTPIESRIGGMIELAYDMVQGRLNAFIHLTDVEDMNTKAGSRTLRRLANVHNIPHANDYLTANVLIRKWAARITLGRHREDFKLFQPKSQRSPIEDALTEEGQVVALIAHDAKKLDMAQFVVEHNKQLRDDYRWILATGHTADLIKTFLRAAGWSPDDEKKILSCLPGPEGGDMEIAAMVIRKKCHKVVFFQDPMQSHPHGPDISLFEQAVLSPVLDAPVPLASNPETASAIL